MSDDLHPLADDPLALEAFEKIRRVGADRADGQTITCDGRKYHMTAHTVSTIRTVHVVLETLDGKAAGHKRAMAIVEVSENGYAGGPGGLDLVLPALCEGIRVHGRPHVTHDYRVLPWLPVPTAFQTIGHDK